LDETGECTLRGGVKDADRDVVFADRVAIVYTI
jgi:hypothetical protein